MTILLLEEVFRTEGLPEFTFVPAPDIAGHPARRETRHFGGTIWNG
jgi:hypothetical protein